MKARIFFAVLLLTLATVAKDWQFVNSSCGWRPQTSLKATERDDGLFLKVTGKYPALFIDNIAIKPADCDYLEIKYAVSGEVVRNGGYLFFGTKARPELNEDAKFYIPNIEVDGKEHTLYLSLINGRGTKLWMGAEAIVSMRLDLISELNNGTILLKSMRLISNAERRKINGWPPVDATEWVFKNTNAGWKDFRHLTPTLHEDGMELDLTGTYSNIEIGDIAFSPKGHEYLQVNYIATGLPKVTTGQLFFGTDKAPKLNETAKFPINSLKSDGKPQSLYISLGIGSGGKEWEGATEINRLRLDLVNQFPGKVKISSIKLVTKDFVIAEKNKKYANIGVPVQVKSEIPKKLDNAKMGLEGANAPHFTSKMVAPKGGHYFVGKNYLRTEFELKGTLRQTLVQSVCDDAIEALYINGRKVNVKWSDFWQNMDVTEIPLDYFREGRNVFCVAYNNSSSIGGLMLDLQLLCNDGTYSIVTFNDGVGKTDTAPADWFKPEFKCDWKKVDTCPGPPNAPWTAMTPIYTSILAKGGTATVKLLKTSGCDVEVTFTGKPAFTEDEFFYGRFCSTQGTVLTRRSGTVKQLGGKFNADGSVTITFRGYDMKLYGLPQDNTWHFSAGKRIMEGDTKVDTHTDGLALPGKPAVLKLQQTANGPVPMLNGKPFYFNILTSAQYKMQSTIPSGMEGKNSPFNVVVLRAGGSPETDWWKGPDKYDFTSLDRSISKLIHLYPDSMLGIYVWCHPSTWYEKTYPERISRAHDGSKYGYYVSTVTFSDPDVRADAQRAVTVLIEHCEKYYGSRMVLYNLMGGISCEWQGWQSHSDKFADFGVAGKRDFAKYAAEHGVANAEVPGFDARIASEGGIFRNPQRDAIPMLYDRYYSESIAECIRGIAEASKKACHGNKLIGCYYGYLLEYASLSYCVNAGGHNDLAALLASPDMDFFLSPQSYAIRAVGMPNGEMKPFASIRAAGKLSILEDDTRTHLTLATGFDQTVNMEQTLNVLKRNVGMYLSHRMPLNQLPLVGGNELDAPEIREMFAKSIKAGQYLMEHGADATAEVAAVVDENALKYLAATRTHHAMEEDSGFSYTHSGELQERTRHVQVLTGELLYYQRVPMGQMGAPVDVILMSDVKRLASRYKVVMFLNAFADNAETREAFAALRAKGTKIVIVYGAGFMGEKGVSAESMGILASMKCALAKPGMLKAKLGDKEVGSHYDVNPRFTVVDANAKVLANYTDSGEAAVVENGNTLFYGMAYLDADFMREYLRRNGVHIYCDTRDNVAAGGSIVSINARTAGRKTIRLPRKCRIEDIYSDKVIADGADSFTLDMKAFESRTFLCK